MKVIELFAGSRSFGKEAEKLGASVLSFDKFITENINIVCDIKDVTKQMIIENIGIPDVIWASPVCSAWSKTGWFHYWDTDIYSRTRKFVPKKEYANESVSMVSKTIEIFSWFPSATFFMENPEGMLQKHPVINEFTKRGLCYNLKKHTVTYCQYGDTVRKPTNIWTNCTSWHPRAKCSNGSECHLSSPRNTQLGIKSKKGNYERSIIPSALCMEILLSISLTPSPHTN